MTRRWTTFFAAVVLVAVTVVVGTAQQESIEETRAKAERGDAQAQYELGVSYEDGRGVPQDDAEAVRWYRLAAEQGHAWAQYELAVNYEDGRGVPQDDLLAHKWANLSASRMGDGPIRNVIRRLRDKIASRLTPDQRIEAQRLAREWNEAHPRD